MGRGAFNIRIKNLHFPTWTVPLALLALCGLSFGLLAPWLGFYWDDWPTVWYLHLLGPSGFLDVFNVDRPLLGWLFRLTTAFVGRATLAWQVFSLFTRWACCLVLWGTLREIWPRNTRPVTWVVFLFAVYPGFTQHPIAVTYSHVWIILSAFFLSIWTMIRSVKAEDSEGPTRASILWLALSVALAALTLFWDEYFFGLELLRPLLLWWALGDRGMREPRVRLRGVVLRWLPYLGVIVVFFYWRFFVHQTPRGQVQVFELLAGSPAGTASDLLKTVFADAIQSSLGAWAQVLNFSRLASYGRSPLVLFLALALVTAPLLMLYLWKLRTDEDRRPTMDDGRTTEAGGRKQNPAIHSSFLFRPSSLPSSVVRRPSSSWAYQAVLLGALALLLGGIPFWATYLPIELRFPWDRFTLAMMFGASLLLAGLLDWLYLSPGAKAALLGLALGLAVGFHGVNANLYRREWNAQKLFFWQLAWRAPAIQPGTVLITAELPFTVYSDNSLTAPLNWTYAPQETSRQMPYLLYAVESRLKFNLPRLEPGVPIEQSYRATSFAGNTSQAIALFSEPPGCVKVVDPQVDARLPQKPNYIDELLPLSDPGLIDPDPQNPARPPDPYFGPEPAHGWCYYFEKADLARQQGDWEQVVKLGDRALKLDERLYEVNAPELVPYIEGYANTGQWDRARDLTQQSLKLSFRMNRMLCDTWSRIAASAADSPEGQAEIANARQKLKCSAP